MNHKKHKIFKYDSHRVIDEMKYDNKGVSYPVNKHFSLEDKLNYYSLRMNDKKLSPLQRKYAKIKVSILASGVGRIYIVDDKELGNNKEPYKQRRVIPTAINYSNGKTLINGIYTSPSRFNSFKVDGRDMEGKINILNSDSYLDVQAKKKLDKTYFNINELRETTSTINPFQLKDVINYVYPKKEKHDIHFKNKINRKQLKK